MKLRFHLQFLKMNPENLGHNRDGPPVMPVKRKRGRPRKDRNQILDRSASIPPRKDENHNHDGSAPVPPGFQGINGNQAQRTDADHKSENSMVGQVVTGVIEASFDAGYLLSVRVGDSETSLRGVVFKPGHYVPISPANDVAPHVHMISRNEVPFPSGNQKRRRGKYRQSREKSEQHDAAYSPNGSAPANQLALARYKQPVTPLAAASQAPPVGARGTVVPVVLQPVNLSNGTPPTIEAQPIASQPAHLASSKGKQMLATNVPKSSQTDEDSSPHSAKDGHYLEGTTAKPGVPFEELVSEVVKRVQGSPHSIDSQHENVRPSKDAGGTSEQSQDLSRPLFIEPLQSICSNDHQPGPIRPNFHDMRTGKMTELLLAVQENLMEKQAADSQQQDK